MAAEKVIKVKETLEQFSVDYRKYSKKFSGQSTVNDGEYEIKVKTKGFDTPEEAYAYLIGYITKEFYKLIDKD